MRHRAVISLIGSWEISFPCIHMVGRHKIRPIETRLDDQCSSSHQNATFALKNATELVAADVKVLQLKRQVGLREIFRWVDVWLP